MEWILNKALKDSNRLPKAKLAAEAAKKKK
jgi:hypothetical protein